MTRVLICGGRTFGERYDERPMEEVLREQTLFLDTVMALHDAEPFSTVITGMAKGADRMAFMWATEMNIPTEQYPAKWELYGKGAGVRRNIEMLFEGKPDLVVAFPGGPGTADMTRRAKDAGVRVIEASPA